MTLLEARDITVVYGGLRANDGVSLTVAEGAMVGLIGPNGAGKTTFIDALTGFAPTAGGSIFIGGESVGQLPTHRRAHHGLARTFQSVQLFDDLTVRENLQVAAQRRPWWGIFADVVRPRGRPAASVEWALELLELGDLAERLPTQLSHGQRKLVGVARALAGEPKLLLLDEPAAGLDSAESHELGRRLRGMLEHGLSVLLVDHDMALVLDVCDTVYVLEFGKLIAVGSPAQIRQDEKVITAYLGASEGKKQAAILAGEHTAKSARP